MKTLINFENSYYKTCENNVIFLKNLLKDKDIIDIGSNIGLFSLAICKNINFNTINLFEPAKDYFDYSKELLKKYDNIDYHNIALGNKEDNGVLFKNPGENIGWNTLYTKDPMQNNNFINKMIKEKVLIKKLDNYNFKNIDFIKIDVEGYECEVLKGAMDTIKKFKPYIFIEVSWGTNHPNWDENKKIYNEIFEIGYEKLIFKDKTEDLLLKPLPLNT